MEKKINYSVFSLDDMAMLVVEIICKHSMQEVRTSSNWHEISWRVTYLNRSGYITACIILAVHYHIWTSLTTMFIGRDLKYIWSPIIKRYIYKSMILKYDSTVMCDKIWTMSLFACRYRITRQICENEIQYNPSNSNRITVLFEFNEGLNRGV